MKYVGKEFILKADEKGLTIQTNNEKPQSEFFEYKEIKDIVKRIKSIKEN